MIKRLILVLYILSQSLINIAQDSTKIEIVGFPLTELSLAIEQTEHDFTTAFKNVESAGNIESLFSQFRAHIVSAEQMRSDTSMEYLNGLQLSHLRDLRIKWQRYQKGSKDIENTILDVANQLEQFKKKIDEYVVKWKITEEEAIKTESIEQIYDRIISVEEKLQSRDKQYREMAEKSFVLIDSISEENIFIASVMKKMEGVEKEIQASIFSRDNSSFYEMLEQKDDSVNNEEKAYQTWNVNLRGNIDFVKNNVVIAWIHLFLFVLFYIMFYSINKSLDSFSNEMLEGLSNFKHFVKWPMVTSVLFGLFISFWLYDNKPTFVTEQILFFVMIPTVILIFGVIKSHYKIALMAFSVLFLMNQFSNLMMGQIYSQRVILLWESIIGLLFGIYFSLPKSVIYSKEIQKNWRFFVRLFPIIPLLFVVSLYANLEGLVQLTKLINEGLLKSAGAGIALLFVVKFIDGLVKYLITSNIGNYIMLLREKKDQIISWTGLIVKIWAIYTWIMETMGLMQVRTNFVSWWNSILEFGWEFGEASLTIGLVVDFLIILIVFSIVANLSRLILEVEILPRFNLKKGVPMAIAVMTRYTLLVLGFFMAIAAAGISLDKLGFMAGALGVGIGFGLQNVVGNFVSGLILIFERPVNLDDVIVAGTVEGVVKEIGIRSSRVRTWDGAEVILPNNDLISNQVTNWTLSDTKRRREHFVKVEYGTDPNKVIEIIGKILENNEDVLNDPAPMVLFLGFKEYSLDFRVLFWLNANLLSGDSTVALSIHNELKNAGINMAVPRQRMIVEDEKNSLKVNKTKTTPQSRRTKKPPEAGV